MWFICLWKSKWCVELTVYPRSAAPSDLLRGHRVQIMHASCTDTQLSTMCCWEGPPPGANSLQCFFFWIKEMIQIYKTIYMLDLEAKSMPKNGEFGLARVYKKLKWKFLNKEFWSIICVNRLLHRWLGREGKVVTGSLCGCSHGRFPFLYHLYCCAGEGWWQWCRMLWWSGGLMIVLCLTVNVQVMEDLWLFYATL